MLFSHLSPEAICCASVFPIKEPEVLSSWLRAAWLQLVESAIASIENSSVVEERIDLFIIVLIVLKVKTLSPKSFVQIHVFKNYFNRFFFHISIQ